MKMHVSMNVDDFDAAVRFYSVLFKQSPTVTRDDYAKWDVESPPVNFVVEPTTGKKAAGFDHIGIQVEDDDDLNELANRMRETGQPHTEMESAHCCYAKSDKAWLKGLATENWELFLTHSHDSTEYGPDTIVDVDIEASDKCCAPKSTASTCCEPEAS